MTLTLVLGGARSGKSAYAQAAAEAAATRGAPPVMIVTAEALDAEMAERIARHRQDRADRWRTVEASHALPAAVDALGPADVAVVDCLTLWLSNLLLDEADLDQAGGALLAAARACPARLWLVSNEVGFGVVPDNTLARRFRDAAGRLHQRLAAEADEVVLVVAGLPMTLKSPSADQPGSHP